MLALAYPGPCHSFGRKRHKGRSKEGSTDELLTIGLPIAKNIGLSGVLGIIAAVAFKVTDS